MERRYSGFRQSETFAGILKVPVVIYSQAEPGTDPDSSSAVLVNRINVFSCETVTRRKARHYALGHAAYPACRSDPNRSFTVLINSRQAARRKPVGNLIPGELAFA